MRRVYGGILHHEDLILWTKKVLWMGIIILLVTLIMPFLVHGQLLEMCEDVMDPPANCTVVTPTMNCTVYQYDIYNATNGVLLDDDLSLYNYTANLYHFNFTKDAGHYVIQLCDATTRELVVRNQEKKMITAFLILLPLIVAFFLMYLYNSQIQKMPQEYWAFKWLFMLLSFYFIMGSLYMGIQGSQDIRLPDNMTNLITTTFTVFTYLTAFMTFYFFIIIFLVVINKLREQA